MSDSAALVTGGSRGIGRAIVEALLAEGWRVAFCAASDDSVAAALAELESAFPGRVAGRRADVRSEAEVEELVAWAAELLGRLDLLVNNAGVGAFEPVDEMSGEEWRRVIETNLCGPFYAIRAATPFLRRAGGGWIINVASLASRNPFAGGAAYNASKFGLLGLSDAAMLDLRQGGIRVAAILPGSVDTGFLRGGGAGGESWKLQPGDVARAVLDLLRYRPDALPSRIELRPTRPPR